MACIQLGVAIAVGLAAPAAVADPHDGMTMAGSSESSLGAGLSVIAARYGPTTYFVGNYQGVTPSVSWTRGSWSATAMLGLYRLEENGRTLYGPGDLMLSSTARLLDHERWRAGITVAAMLPTGDEPTGLGMGHVMAMPSAWIASHIGQFELRTSIGYDRALASLAGHDHGLWPLVEPMNLQEVSWAASAALPVWRQLEVGARGYGGVPFGVATGVDRIAGGVRATWVDPRVLTSVELQLGITGDPYVVRALVETMVRL